MDPRSNNNYVHSDNEIIEIRDFNHKQMMYILTRILNETEDENLIDNKELFISYFEQNKMDGNAVMSMNREQFAEDISQYFDSKRLTDERMSWTLGSFCSIYCRSQKTWFVAEIIHIYMVDNQEWFIVKYDTHKSKNIQRYCNDIRPLIPPTKSVYCIHGSSLEPQRANSCYKSSSSVICDNCKCSLDGNMIVYHCSDGKRNLHQYGYDLCAQCAITYSAASPLCMCGSDMIVKDAMDCSSRSNGVSCNKCSEKISGDKAVYHCKEHKNKVHPGGFDLCIGCGYMLAFAKNKFEKPCEFLIIPAELESVDDDEPFQYHKLHYWPNAFTPEENEQYENLYKYINIQSLTSYLSSSAGYTARSNLIAFNAKQSSKLSSYFHGSKKEIFYGNMMLPYVNIDVHEKYLPYTSHISVSSFPALIAQMATKQFSKHEQLKDCMNKYQSNDANDVSIRKMTEKYNENKRWNVFGLIDPDKNLSTLDHSLNDDIENSNMDIMNYHHWIPSVFKVNNDMTKCELLSEIPNLNPYKYKNSLYQLITELFLFHLPQFENVTKQYLREFPLKVVVKAQDYQLVDCFDDDSYLGNMHKEGLYEDISAVGLYYYQIDQGIKGGELELSSVINVKDSKWRKGVTTLKQTKMSVKEKTSLVFSNDLCYHRVSKLYGNGSRKIIAFFLLRPNKSSNIPIDARFVVVNWKFHAKHLVIKWLKLTKIQFGCEWMLDVIFEYIIGNTQYIDAATELYNQCRRGYVHEISFTKHDITSAGSPISRRPTYRRRTYLND